MTCGSSASSLDHDGLYAATPAGASQGVVLQYGQPQWEHDGVVVLTVLTYRRGSGSPVNGVSTSVKPTACGREQRFDAGANEQQGDPPQLVTALNRW